MNANISVFVIFVEAVICLLLYNLRNCTFNLKAIDIKRNLVLKIENLKNEITSIRRY